MQARSAATEVYAGLTGAYFSSRLAFLLSLNPARGESGFSSRKGNAMSTGTVKWFNDSKGFGFI